MHRQIFANKAYIDKQLNENLVKNANTQILTPIKLVKGETQTTRQFKYAIQKLLEKELVIRNEGLCRPLLYGNSDKFMDYMGINSLNDLPKPKDFKEVENSIGDVPPLEETFESQN